MRTFRFLLLAFGLIFMIGFTTSCDNNQSASEQVEEAGDDMADAFRTEREELQADLREARNNINNKLAELRGELSTASEETKEDINDQIDKLEKWGDSLDKDMDRVSNSVQNGWETLKGNVRKTLDEIQDDWDDTFDS